MIDFLKTVLFESLPWLLFFCAAGVAVALAVHRRRLTARSRRGIWLTVAVGALLVAVQTLVHTDRERLTEAVQAMARAVDEGDMDAFSRYVAPELTWRGGGRREFLDDVTSRLTTTQIDGARLSQVRASVTGDTATVSFTAVCDLRNGRGDQDRVVSFWRLGFVRTAGRWLMNAVLDARIHPGGVPAGDGIDLKPMIR